MRQLWLLTISNIKKSKANTVSLLCMIILTAIVMNIGLITGRNYASFFDQRAEKLHAGEVMIVLQNHDPLYTKTYEQTLYEDERTKEVEKRNVQLINGSCAYADSASNRMFTILNKKDPVKLNQYEIIEESTRNIEHPIYLPYLFQIGGGYEIGDSFTFEIANGKFQYEVAGFFDEISLGTINSTTTGLLLEDADYQALSTAFLGNNDAYLYHITIHDPSMQEVYATDHMPHPTSANTLFDTNFYETIRMSRTNTSSIGSMLLIAFAIILSLISAVIIRFRIVNTIEEDVQNIGALKAIGYTGIQISGSILLQFLSISFAASLLGSMLSYAFLPLVSMMFAMQTGVDWVQGFDASSSFLTIIAILTVVVLVAGTSSYKILKLHPIVALRTGIKTHSFKRNPIPLDSSHGSLLSMLAQKIWIQEGKQNLMIGIIILGICFATVFAGILYENITIRFDRFLIMTIGEVNDLAIDANTEEDAKAVKEALQSDPDIRKVIDFTMDTIKSEQGDVVYVYTSEKMQDLDYQEMIYEGRFPQYDNEVAIGGILAKNMQKQVGDAITLVKGEHSYTYLITGLIQGSNYMGHDAAMNQDAYSHIRPEFANMSLNVYLHDIEKGDAIMEKISTSYDAQIQRVRNVRKSMEASLAIYKQMVQMLVVIIASIMVCVIVLTLYLILKTSILRKRKELGIQKAIGFTTKQMILQNALSFLPTILIGSLLGGVIGYGVTNPLLSVLFSSFGIMRVSFHISILMILCFIIGITAFGFLICVLVSLRIRKISPYALMSE